MIYRIIRLSAIRTRVKRWQRMVVRVWSHIFSRDDTNSYCTKPRPPSSRITKRLSARGKHLLLKCTLRSVGASIFQRAPELFVFTVSPSNYWRWAHVANGRAINRSIIVADGLAPRQWWKRNPLHHGSRSREIKRGIKLFLLPSGISEWCREIFLAKKGRKRDRRTPWRSFRRMNSERHEFYLILHFAMAPLCVKNRSVLGKYVIHHRAVSFCFSIIFKPSTLRKHKNRTIRFQNVAARRLNKSSFSNT